MLLPLRTQLRTKYLRFSVYFSYKVSKFSHKFDRISYVHCFCNMALNLLFHVNLIPGTVYSHYHQSYRHLVCPYVRKTQKILPTTSWGYPAGGLCSPTGSLSLKANQASQRAPNSALAL